MMRNRGDVVIDRRIAGPDTEVRPFNRIANRERLLDIFFGPQKPKAGSKRTRSHNRSAILALFRNTDLCQRIGIVERDLFQPVISARRTAVSGSHIGLEQDHILVRF